MSIFVYIRAGVHASIGARVFSWVRVCARFCTCVYVRLFDYAYVFVHEFEYA